VLSQPVRASVCALYCALSACSDNAQTAKAHQPSAPKYSLDRPAEGLGEPAARDANFRRGVSLDLFLAEVDEGQRATYGAWLDQAAQLGATDLELVVQWSQLDAGATEIAPSATMTVDDEFLGWLLDQAHQHQLRVLVTPVIELEQASAKPQRRTLAPSDPARWFWSYHRFLLHYARIAEAHHATCYAVGADLPDVLVQDAAAWSSLIKDVRKAFKGKLTYAARWESFDKVPFWGEVDEVSLAALGELWTSSTPGNHEAVLAQRLRDFGKSRKRTFLLSSLRTASAAAPGADKRGSLAQLDTVRSLYQRLQGDHNISGVYVAVSRPFQPAQLAPPDIGSAAAQVLRHWYTRSRRATN
jgi:hypothetical protein